jgi:hypothetical protein
MSSLAEDFSLYNQFEKTAEAEPDPTTNRARVVTEQHRKGGFLGDILSRSWKRIRRSHVDEVLLPSTTDPPAIELRVIGPASREFSLEVLEWNRSKATWLARAVLMNDCRPTR